MRAARDHCTSKASSDQPRGMLTGDSCDDCPCCPQDVSTCPQQTHSNSFATNSDSDKQAPQSVAYVAIGDSFSAGNGGEFSEEENEEDFCSQATDQAWPAQIASWLQEGTWVHAACSGYTTGQISGVVDNVLSPANKWITITAGGNDIFFARTVRECMLSFWVEGCLTQVAESCACILGLQDSLKSLFQKIAEKAPNAYIYVAGYPDIVPYDYCLEQGFLTDCEIVDMRSLVNPLNDQVAAAVSWANDVYGRFQFVDVRSVFYGHEPCADDAFVNGIQPFDIWKTGKASFHPNRDGQCAYARTVWYYMTGQTQQMPECPALPFRTEPRNDQANTTTS